VTKLPMNIWDMFEFLSDVLNREEGVTHVGDPELHDGITGIPVVMDDGSSFFLTIEDRPS
jgi:hypothetical protein